MQLILSSSSSNSHLNVQFIAQTLFNFISFLVEAYVEVF